MIFQWLSFIGINISWYKVQNLSFGFIDSESSSRASLLNIVGNQALDFGQQSVYLILFKAIDQEFKDQISDFETKRW